MGFQDGGVKIMVVSVGFGSFLAHGVVRSSFLALSFRGRDYVSSPFILDSQSGKSTNTTYSKLAGFHMPDCHLCV